MKLMLLPAMLALTPYYLDQETPEERHARYAIVDAAINVAAEGDLDKASFLVMTAYAETRFARHVHEDRCRVDIGECDSGRAKSLWQLQSHASLPKARWQQLGGTDLESTTAAAIEAGKAFDRARNHCGSLEGAIALYATGQSCIWDKAPARARFMRKIRRKIRLIAD